VQIGGISGQLSYNSTNLRTIQTVDNCHFSGSVNFTTTDDGMWLYIGGAFGQTYGRVKNCSVNATVNVTAPLQSGTPNSLYRVGGFVGWAGGESHNIITDCYANSTVNVSHNVASGECAKVGGFAGYHDTGTIRNCYVLGTVNDSDTADTTWKFSNGGSFVGYSASGTITNCFSAISTFSAGASGTTESFGTKGTTTVADNFWDKTTSGRTTASATATGKTTAELQQFLPTMEPLTPLHRLLQTQ
jgi:hypothetical protein